MKCHYINVKGVGKVLIPGCMAVAVSGDIEDCTCHPTTFQQFEKERYNKEVERLKGIIKRLEDENEYYAELLAKNEIEIDYLTNEEDEGDRVCNTTARYVGLDRQHDIHCCQDATEVER